MASPGVTPFIPPLNTPGPSPNPPQPPLAPTAPTGPNQQYPAWASQPQTAGSYPFYPNTPYNPQTPFLPPQPGMPPQYFPGTGGQPPQMQLPDFGGGGGYTPFGPPPAWAGTPWAIPGGGLPPGTPWQGAGQPSPYPAFGGPPLAAFAPHGPAQMRPAGWGPQPPMMGAFTPGPTPGDPWQAQPPWAQAQAQAQMQAQMGMGMGMGGMPGGMMGSGMMGGMGGMGLGFGAPAFGGMAEPQQPLSRAIGQVGDRVGQFEAGPNYGPVLEPFLVRAVRAHVRLNPLIHPLAETGGQPYLKWNMLFPSNQCQRSDDPVHISWAKGRKEPLTFPRVTFVRLVSDAFPWAISITAHNRDIGVTCGDLIDQVSRDMYQLTGQAEYEALGNAKKRTVADAYRHNRSRANGVPGGQLNPGMLRLDWLGLDTMFGGVRENERLVRRICGDVLPCTFELVCVKRYPMTAEEIRNQELMQRAISTRESERSARRRSQRPTVEVVRAEEESTTNDDEAEEGEEDDSEEEGEGRRGRRGRS
ncbi:hypothetical protein B0H15DRAFT_382226 [Mycena belliarum]|uniref:DUF6699 domain-containing protein n=1 Tax=Mycena belliarum TaxID=1033014 RepID=A0AAD6XP91_9AGAR|nr:hypothetical protein B0H15DRAFT_382226 [Mycena belliae]